MFVSWGFCAFCKSVGLFQRCEHWISAPSFFKSLQHLFLPLCCSYIVMIFYYFLSYCIIFYTHILLNLYICCLFFKNCLILLMFSCVSLILFGNRNKWREVHEIKPCALLQLGFTGFVQFFFLLKLQIFSHVFLWELRFKSLSNRFACGAAEVARLSLGEDPWC